MNGRSCVDSPSLHCTSQPTQARLTKELSFYLSVTGLRHIKRQNIATLKTEYDEQLDFLYFSHPIVNVRIRKPFLR